MSFWSEPLTDDQKHYIYELIDSDNIDQVRKVLQNGIENKKDPPGGRLHLDEHTNIGPDWLKGNLLHMTPRSSAIKCVDLLINAPYSWNIEMPDSIGLTPMYIAECSQNPGTSIKMAPFSKQIRPYPATFTVIDGENFVQHISNFLLWPQLALFDQPSRMKSHLERITKFSIYKIEEHIRDVPRRRDVWEYHGADFGFICELLLANAELVNADLTTDGRLPYDDLTHIDSSRMWPISPIPRNFIDGHINCNDYPRCMHKKNPDVLMNIWKIHRFGHTSSDPEPSKSKLYNLTPPSLKEFSRLMIRRQMVRHVEPLNSDLKEYNFPNQTILLRYLSLPKHLMAYMLFPDIPIDPNPENRSILHFHDVLEHIQPYPTDDRGTLVFNGFIPNSFDTLYP